MPLTLSVGHSRKVGEPNYSSRGASVNLELEVEGNLVNEPQRLRESIRKLFALARAAVEEELHGAQAGRDNQSATDTNGHSQPPATASQRRAIHALARRHDVDLAELIQDRFGAACLERLSLSQASELIDDLNHAPLTTGAT